MRKDQTGMIAPIAIIAMLGLTVWGGIAFTKYQVAKDSNFAAVSKAGTYGSTATKPALQIQGSTIGLSDPAPLERLKQPFVCKETSGTSQPAATAGKVDPGSVLDTVRHPLITAMRKNGGECVVRSAFYSMRDKLKLADLKDAKGNSVPFNTPGGNVNFDAFENIAQRIEAKNQPQGKIINELESLPSLYTRDTTGKSTGRACDWLDFAKAKNAAGFKEKCGIVAEALTEGYDCTLIIKVRSKSKAGGFGHTATIDTAKSDPKKGCVMSLYDTDNEGVPLPADLPKDELSFKFDNTIEWPKFGKGSMNGQPMLVMCCK